MQAPVLVHAVHSSRFRFASEGTTPQQHCFRRVGVSPESRDKVVGRIVGLLANAELAVIVRESSMQDDNPEMHRWMCRQQTPADSSSIPLSGEAQRHIVVATVVCVHFIEDSSRCDAESLILDACEAYWSGVVVIVGIQGRKSTEGKGLSRLDTFRVYRHQRCITSAERVCHLAPSSSHSRQSLFIEHSIVNFDKCCRESIFGKSLGCTSTQLSNLFVK